jgi:hypothetical protein
MSTCVSFPDAAETLVGLEALLAADHNEENTIIRATQLLGMHRDVLLNVYDSSNE